MKDITKALILFHIEIVFCHLFFEYPPYRLNTFINGKVYIYNEILDV